MHPKTGIYNGDILAAGLCVFSRVAGVTLIVISQDVSLVVVPDSAHVAQWCS